MYIHVYKTTGSVKTTSSLEGSWKEQVEGRAVMYCGGESDRVSQTLTPSSMIRDKASFSNQPPAAHSEEENVYQTFGI